MKTPIKNGRIVTAVDGNILKKMFVLLLIVLFSAPLAAQENQTALKGPLVFRNVTLIDMRSDKPSPNMTVVISGNRISKIGKNVKIPKNATVIDATGKFLIPGLWDMHAHSIWNEGTRRIFFPLEIANGITGVRDMFSDCYPDCSHNNGTLEDGVSLDEVNEWRRQTNAGTLIAPRIVASSPLIDGPDAGWKGSYIVKNAEEGREAVRYIKRRGNDFIKVYSYLPREAYFAIADEAKKQKLIFAGHIPENVSAEEASDAGQKSVEHLYGIMLSSSTDEANLRSEVALWAANKGTMTYLAFEKQLLATYSDKKASALFARFVRNKTWMSPTLVVLRPGAYFDDKDFVADSRLKYLPPSLREYWDSAKDSRIKKLKPEDFVFQKKLFQKYVEIVGAMRRAGVKIIAGGDAPNPYCFPGFSLHDELALYVKAGLTPLEALQTATINAAKYLDMADSLGTIEKGKLADLVLLDANPLDDISHTKRIAAVITNGKYLPKETLEKMLADVETWAKTK